MRRIVLAFLVAPAVVPVFFAVYATLQGAGPDALPVAAVAALYAYLSTLIAGVPATYAYHRLGWTRWWQFALGGFVLATLGFAAGLATLLHTAATYGSIGAVSAVVFWLVGVRDNPAFAPLRNDRIATGLAVPSGRSPADAGSPPLAPGPPQPSLRPVAGIVAVAIPLFVTLWTVPLAWNAAHRELASAFGHAFMLVAIFHVVAIHALAVAGLAMAVVALARREPHRFILAPAALVLNLLGYAAMMRGI